MTLATRVATLVTTDANWYASPTTISAAVRAIQHGLIQYEIDAYHPDWQCGLEVESGRAWKGNAVYRDLIQALVMVQVKHLALAVPLSY